MEHHHTNHHDNTNGSSSSGTNSTSTTNNNISSVDYFLLFDNDHNNNDNNNIRQQHYHHPAVASPNITNNNNNNNNHNGTVVNTENSGGSRDVSIMDTESKTGRDTMKDGTNNVTVPAPPQQQQLSRVEPKNGSNSSNSSNSIHIGNRDRLGSANTNTSISTTGIIGMNGTDSHNNNNHKAATASSTSSSVVVGVKEQIYFDDTTIDVGTVPSTTTTTTLERGESSSYSLFVSSSNLTTPFLSTSDPILSSSRHEHRNRLYSNGSDTIPHHQQSRHRSRSSSRRRRRSRIMQMDIPELSGLNILNAVTYTIHLCIWWLCGVWGMNHTIYTHWEQTQINETLITPTTFSAHYLWVPIMIFEGIFTIAQLLSNYRARPIITSGTSYFFFYTVLLQITYTLLYGFGLFVFSFISIVLALVALLSLLASQQYHGSADLPGSTHRGLLRTTISGGGNHGSNGRWFSSHRMVEYILFSFPFYLHTGWLILMAVDHFSLLFRRYNSAIDAQLASDIVGLGILLGVAIYALNQPMAMGPDFVIPTVVLWSYVGIVCRLCYPSDTMIDAYGLIAIGAIRIATFCFIGIIGCCMIPHIVICLAREFCTINVIELE